MYGGSWAATMASMSFFTSVFPAGVVVVRAPIGVAARPLHASISVCLVIIADIEEIGAAFECPGKRLDPDIQSPPVTCIDDNVGLLPDRTESIRHAGSARSSSSKRNVVNRYIEGGIRVYPLDDTCAASGYDEDRIRTSRLKHVPESERVAAPGACGRTFQHIFLFWYLGDSLQLPECIPDARKEIAGLSLFIITIHEKSIIIARLNGRTDRKWYESAITFTPPLPAFKRCSGNKKVGRTKLQRSGTGAKIGEHLKPSQ